MVDDSKDFLVHEEEEFVEIGEDQDENLDYGFISDDSDEKNETGKTPSLTWMMKTIKNMLMKVVMKIIAVLIVSTLRRILTKKARN